MELTEHPFHPRFVDFAQRRAAQLPYDYKAKTNRNHRSDQRQSEAEHFSIGKNSGRNENHPRYMYEFAARKYDNIQCPAPRTCVIYKFAYGFGINTVSNTSVFTNSEECNQKQHQQD